VFLKQNDGLIKMYYLKIRWAKQTVVFLAVTRAETCDVKPKYVLIENVSGSKDRVERTKAWESALLIGKPSSNYMRVCGKHLKK
jgi:hypothetical protein